jgi:hypothetical protein
MIAALGLAGFLVGHALIHGGFLAPAPRPTPGSPPWPFQSRSSRLLETLRLHASATTLRILATALVAATIGGFGMAALVVIGVAPAGLFAAGIAVGALASLGALMLFFHPWLALGVAIDVVLLWAALFGGWVPDPAI